LENQAIVESNAYTKGHCYLLPTVAESETRNGTESLTWLAVWVQDYGMR